MRIVVGKNKTRVVTIGNGSTACAKHCKLHYITLFCTHIAFNFSEYNTANSVAQCDYNETDNRFNTPVHAHPEIEHVCDAVFKTAKNKHHNTKEKGEVFAHFKLNFAVAFNRDINHNITEYTKQEKAEIAVCHFHITKALSRSSKFCAIACCRGYKGDNACAYKVAEPYNRNLQSELFVVLAYIANLTCIKVQTIGTDCKKPDSKEHRADNLVFAHKIDYTAEADTASCKNGRYQYFEITHFLPLDLDL